MNALVNLNLAALLAAIEAGEIETQDGIDELQRRVDKRAAAGKHPMLFVVEALEALRCTAEA